MKERVTSVKVTMFSSKIEWRRSNSDQGDCKTSRELMRQLGKRVGGETCLTRPGYPALYHTSFPEGAWDA